jgi:type IX secretion system PorP/SprF family membrane protein
VGGHIRILVLFLAGCWLGTIHAQQDPMFTKYMFSSMLYNPAYAGVKGYMSTTVLQRLQWTGIEGGPRTTAFQMDSPLFKGRVGVGMSLIADEIGPSDFTSLQGVYAYRLSFGDQTLAFGLQAGFEQFRVRWDQIQLQVLNDGAFQDPSTTWVQPVIGAGIYYEHPYFYAGFSTPQLIEQDLLDPRTQVFFSRQVRHYYLTAGGAIPLLDWMVFKPSLLIKIVEGQAADPASGDDPLPGRAPSEFDVDLAVLLQNAYWIGVSLRSGFPGNDLPSAAWDSFDIWMAWTLASGIRFGLAYDYPLNKLSIVSPGSFELMIGYDFKIRKNKIVPPRYF